MIIYTGPVKHTHTHTHFHSLSRTHAYKQENQISEQQAVTIDNKLTHLQSGHKMAHTLSSKYVDFVHLFINKK